MAVRVHVAVDAAGRPRDFELVERKGIGHPDTICDGVAEEFARRLCRFYLDRFGVILHHNVDKALLRAGAARTAFGGGEVVEAIELFLGGRATEEHRGVSVPVAELAREAAQDWFARHFHALDPARHLRVHCLTRPGSRDLTELFARVGAGEVPLANDTSCGVGFAPRTRLERAVQGIEEQINAPQTKRLHPEWGEDVKVLGFRHGSRASITLACAFVDAFVPDLETYRRSRESLARAAQARGAAELGFEPALAVNAGDDVDAGRIYLTVTGTSAEAGDDGEVGRGNRLNGLITPQRPMTLEAAAGKNPVNHVGKLYSWAAPRIAQALVDRIEAVEEAHCMLVSRIGQPVHEPALVALELRTPDGALPESARTQAEEIACAELARLRGPSWKDWLARTD